MPIGKKGGKIKSPLYEGGSTPAGLPSSADNKKSGTVGPSGLGSAKNPPAGQVASPKREKGNLSSPSKSVPEVKD